MMEMIMDDMLGVATIQMKSDQCMACLTNTS